MTGWIIVSGKETKKYELEWDGKVLKLKEIKGKEE